MEGSTTISESRQADVTIQAYVNNQASLFMFLLQQNNENTYSTALWYR